MRLFTGFVCLLILSGCGIAAKADARHDYQRSLADYRGCLQANASNVHACESQRLMMEADQRAYEDFAAGIQTGGNRSVLLNTQAR